MATFNTRLKKLSSFSTLISSNYSVNGIVCPVPKSLKIHVFSLCKQKYVKPPFGRRENVVKDLLHSWDQRNHSTKK